MQPNSARRDYHIMNRETGDRVNYIAFAENEQPGDSDEKHDHEKTEEHTKRTRPRRLPVVTGCVDGAIVARGDGLDHYGPSVPLKPIPAEAKSEEKSKHRARWSRSHLALLGL